MSNPIDEFVASLQALLNVKPPGVSGSKIRKLTEIAMRNVQSESVLIQKLYTHFKKTPASHKLGAIYAVDAVVRGYQDEAKKAGQEIGPDAPEGTAAAAVYRVSELFETLMADIFANPIPAEQKEKIRKLVDIWERAETFDHAKLEAVREKYFQPEKSTTPSGEPPSHAIEAFEAAKEEAKNNKSAGSGAAAVPDTASILQALASIAKQKPADGQSSTPPPPPSLALGGAQLPQPPFPSNSGPNGSSSNTNAPNIMQYLSSMNQNQGAPTSAAAVTGQPWNLGGQAAPPPPPIDPRGRDHRGGDYRGGERRRSQSPGRRPSYSPGGRRGSARDRSRSPPRRRYDSPPTNSMMSPPLQEGQYGERNVSYDNSLPPGTVRVLSRTLFIGGVPPFMTEEELANVFKPFARVQSMVFHKEKKHAFVKVFTRKDAEYAKERFEEMSRNGSLTLRARWGVGFGPRDCSDYQTGVSIIPIARLTDADRRWIVSAEYGGTGGRPLVPGIVIEEPDIEIGSGVSSKAISRRMPTNSSRNGPRSSRGDSHHSGGERERHRYNSHSSDYRKNSNAPSSIPPELASLISGISNKTQHQPSQSPPPQHDNGNFMPNFQQNSGAGQMPSFPPPPNQSGQMPNFPFPPQMAAFLQQHQQQQNQQPPQ